MSDELESVQARGLKHIEHLGHQITVTRGSDEVTGTLTRIEHGCDRVDVTRIGDVEDQFVEGRPWVRITVQRWGLDVQLAVDEWVKVRF